MHPDATSEQADKLQGNKNKFTTYLNFLLLTLSCEKVSHQMFF
jgi:hypothetical protein